MDGFLAAAAALGIAGIVTIALAAGHLNEARDEFQGRLRDRALKRAHLLLTVALCFWGGAATVAAYGTADLLRVQRRAENRPALTTVPDAPRVGRQLKPSPALDASRLRPHVREQEHVADRG